MILVRSRSTACIAAPRSAMSFDNSERDKFSTYIVAIIRRMSARQKSLLSRWV